MNDDEADQTDYQPLIAVIGVAMLAGLALEARGFNLMPLLNHFMGFFFLLLAMFKFFNVAGFADGFQKYDLIARRVRLYAYLYPVIELGLGMLFLSGLYPVFTNAATLIVMIVSGLGVLIAVRGGKHLRCACMGTVLNVPLSTVSMVENFGMGLMAAFMLSGIF